MTPRNAKLLQLKSLNRKIEQGKASRQEVLAAIDLRRWLKRDRENTEHHNANYKPRIPWTNHGRTGIRGFDI